MPKPRRGRPPKLGDYQAYPLRMPVDLHRELRHLALDEGCSLNDLLVQVIQEWWQARGRRRGRSDQPPKGREGRSAASRLRFGSVKTPV